MLTFQKSLTLLKIGLIVFFILVTIVYQAKFRKIKPATTFFGHKGTTVKVLADSAITGTLGVLTIIILITTRAGVHRIPNHWKACLMIFLILFLFNMAQESSGLNRYLAESETGRGEGPYASLDGTTTPEGRIIFNNIDKQGDFFVTATAYSGGIILVLVIGYLVYKMVEFTFIGYKSGRNDIGNLPGLGVFGPFSLFLIELILVVGLNGAGPIISTKLRGEAYDKTKIGIVVFICIIVFCIHVMFQYNGLHNF